MIINPQLLKLVLPIAQTIFLGPKDIQASEVWLYFLIQG